MYIKKSWISGAVITVGILVLSAVALLYSFTNIDIPGVVYIFIWLGGITGMKGIVSKIETNYE